MTIDTGTAAAVVLILGGFASAVGFIIKALTAAKLQILEAGAARQMVNAQKLDEIDAKVNGSATSAAAKIDKLHGDVAEAKGMIADLHQTAAVLAAKKSKGA